MDSKFLAQVCKFTSGILGRSLESNEIDGLPDFIKENSKFLIDFNNRELLIEYSGAYADYLESNTIEGLENLDTDEEIQQESSTVHTDLIDFMGCDTIEKFITELMPKTERKIAYMCLDSRYAQFSPDCKKLTWNVSQALSDTSNLTNIIGPVRDICSIRMLSIVTRKFDSIAQRASILIEELSAQSFSLPNGRKFHFIGLLNDLQYPLNLALRAAGIGTQVPDVQIWNKYELLAGYRFNEGYYRFNKPITSLDTCTISIADPFNVVVIPKYEFFNVAISFETYSSGPSVGKVRWIYLDFPEPHNYDITPFNVLFNPYSIFIDDFTTDQPVLDADLITNINALEWTYTLADTSTRITIDIRKLTAGFKQTALFPTVVVDMPVGAPSTVRVRMLTFRVIMNFELEYIPGK